ncbi:hypothetical protein GTW37_17015 [Streptomyces sp. SID4931]|nr:hypothetical protein [Streptomyces sp. SID4931]
MGTWTYFAHSSAEKAAMLRLAVHMTNVVTGKLGCGGEPLPAPADGAVPDEGTHVPRARAKGTACDALATTRVPAAGRDGEVHIAIADGGIVGRCTLRATETYEDAREGQAIIELTAWRGDWGPAGSGRWGSGPRSPADGPGHQPEARPHRAPGVGRRQVRRGRRRLRRALGSGLPRPAPGTGHEVRAADRGRAVRAARAAAHVRVRVRGGSGTARGLART